MKNIHICLLILLFFGCVNSGNLNDKINILIPPSLKMVELLKNLREFELIVEDHFNYNIKEKVNNETVDKKTEDINYVISLTNRYEQWYLNWDKKMELIGKELNDSELKFIKYTMQGVFDRQIRLNSLTSISDYVSDLYPKDSLFLNQY
ncbi:MAG: hypothetical protein ACJZ1Q_07440 [Candidatus Neomarinimicrobiota bacterium]|nr:hypothetical protein [Candidatus Neomarinimicrobiota bacterium]|tara:strand:+ start:504 stop:950 length:447 start_codon:yes stop_codon:yes gene_type:complete